MKTALFVGRFQPFHKGHLHAIENILKDYNKVVILIGSVNKKDGNNPFSFEERRKMIDGCLKHCKNRYGIIGMPDMPDDDQWTKSILKKARFDVVVTGNDHVRRCFKAFNVPTTDPVLLQPRKYSATEIRKLMKEGKKWEHLVPEEVVKVIKSLNVREHL
jgi:nicotinamide-nucleotide adenylyltransferase